MVCKLRKAPDASKLKIALPKLPKAPKPPKPPRPPKPPAPPGFQYYWAEEKKKRK
jgi:hypothetical protein